MNGIGERNNMVSTINMTHLLYARLRTNRLFASLSDKQYAELIKAARIEEVPAGAVLMCEGDDDGDYLVLLEGELEVRRLYCTAQSAEVLEVGRIFPGEGAGEFAALFGLPRQASVRALVPAKVLRIDGERIESILAWSQQFGDDLRGTAERRAGMNLVRQTALFRTLPLERVRMAFECMQVLDIASGVTVVRERDSGDHYYIIEMGTALVQRSDPMTGDSAQVATLGPGDAFGEEALLLGGFRNATVTFTSPGRLLVLRKEDFDMLMRPLLVLEIAAEAALTMVQQGTADWLDCRYDMEYDEAHIPGAANAPLDKLRELAAGLDPNRPYIVYCRSGRRSVAGAFLLRERGFKAYSLIGGIRDWPYALEDESVSRAGWAGCGAHAK